MADHPTEGELPLWQTSHQHNPLFSDDILNFMAEIRPTRAELMSMPVQQLDYSSSNPIVPLIANEAMGEDAAGSVTPMQPDDHTVTPMQPDDHMMGMELEPYYQPNVEWTSEAGPSTYFPGESSRPEREKFDGGGSGGGGGGDGGVNRQLSIVPVMHSVPPISCSCCLVLREIIHTNGVNTKKLEIHGRFGILRHAILHEYFPIINNDPNSLSATQYKMFDFSKKSTDEVKQFIMQYYLNQILDDYTVLPEPLSDFYDVLCVGLDWDDHNSTSPDIDPQPVPLDTVEEEGESEEDREDEEREDEPQMEDPEAATGRRRVPQTPLAKQRQRTGKMTVNDFKEYLHLPISEAAKKMNLCLTVVKKICRRSGLRRWPYRKVRSYQKKMGAVGTRMRSRDPETRARAEAEMERLKQELSQFCAGIVLD